MPDGHSAMGPKHLLFLFLDGVGIGNLDPAVNPFFSADLKTLRKLLGGNLPHLGSPTYRSDTLTFKPIDANLGVPGLPQSGTGQTTLLTGVNAAKMIGKHYGPYPYSTLRPLLVDSSIYRRLESIHRSGFYANAFPRQFFDHVKSHGTHIAATTYAWLSAGNKLN